MFEGRPDRRTLLLENGLRIELPADPAPGPTAVAVLRPERVGLRAPGAGRIDGTVTDAVFLGQSVRYHVALPDGREMLAVQPDTAVRAGPGAAVGLHWDTSDIWIIPNPD